MGDLNNSHYFLKYELKDLATNIPMHPFVFNIIKYVIRYSKKGTPTRDIEKALDYLNMLRGVAPYIYRLKRTTRESGTLVRFIRDNSFTPIRMTILEAILEGDLGLTEINLKRLSNEQS